MWVIPLIFGLIIMATAPGGTAQVGRWLYIIAFWSVVMVAAALVLSSLTGL